MTDPIDEAAEKIASDLEHLETGAQEAFRYLWARVAAGQGLLTLIGQEFRPSGHQFVYQEPASGKLYRVARPTEWTDTDERSYVAEMRQRLLGE